MFVFIHGSGCTGSVFSAQTLAFPGSLAIDLPGHRTPPLEGAASIVAYADAVERELETRGFEGAVLCGSSMGGAIALEIGLRANPRVGAIVMLGSGSKLRVAPALFESLERDFDAGVRGVVHLLCRANARTRRGVRRRDARGRRDDDHRGLSRL